MEKEGILAEIGANLHGGRSYRAEVTLCGNWGSAWRRNFQE
jgi:hypothetical protein